MNRENVLDPLCGRIGARKQVWRLMLKCTERSMPIAQRAARAAGLYDRAVKVMRDAAYSQTVSHAPPA